MKDLFTVVKEATNKVRSKYPIGESLLTNDELQDLKEIVLSIYRKQSFWWRVKNSLKDYNEMIMLDFKYNFMGGGILKEGEDTVIEIK